MTNCSHCGVCKLPFVLIVVCVNDQLVYVEGRLIHSRIIEYINGVVLNI